MAKKITYEEVSKVYEEKGYELISEYKGNNKPLFVKDKEGYICSSSYSSFKNGAEPNKFHTHNPYTVQNLKLWIKTNIEGYELLSTKYTKAKDKLKLKCDKGHEFEMSWDKINQGNRCPYCSGNKVLKGYNDITTTDPWMIDLGMSIEDAEKYTHSSGCKVIVTCPYCNKKKQIFISNIYRYKSICCSCGDGISYNEKIIISVLDQLEIEYIREYKPEWSNNKKYDFYLIDYNIIIECHGGQHYKESFSTCGGRTLKEEKENDLYKKELALSNGVNNYIILDCRKSELEWIKQSILNSELNNLFDLSKIDWLKCEEFALSNRAKEICDYWNNKEIWESTITMEKTFNLNRTTIRKYLKQGSKLGWCVYDSKFESSKGSIAKSKPVEIFKDGESLGVFPSCMELERQSEELFNVKLLNRGIGEVCRGEKPQYKGFTFRYVTQNK